MWPRERERGRAREGELEAKRERRGYVGAQEREKRLRPRPTSVSCPYIYIYSDHIFTTHIYYTLTVTWEACENATAAAIYLYCIQTTYLPDTFTTHYCTHLLHTRMCKGRMRKCKREREYCVDTLQLLYTCFTTASLLLYLLATRKACENASDAATSLYLLLYCFTTASPLLYYCFTYL